MFLALIVVLGGMVALVGVSVLSALVVAKKTDDIVECKDRFTDDLSASG